VSGGESETIYRYFTPNWIQDYVSFLDIETLGYLTYQGYSMGLILIGIA
jgi:uncharacterized protein YprB with RNaseH-like and TPR domain